MGSRSPWSLDRLFSPQPTLIEAVKIGDISLIKVLISQNVDINAKEETPPYRTALHQAIIWNNIPCVEVLLFNDADPTIEDKDGKTALDYDKMGVITEFLAKQKKTTWMRKMILKKTMIPFIMMMIPFI